MYGQFNINKTPYPWLLSKFLKFFHTLVTQSLTVTELNIKQILEEFKQWAAVLSGILPIDHLQVANYSI